MPPATEGFLVLRNFPSHYYVAKRRAAEFSFYLTRRLLAWLWGLICGALPRFP
jgi:hypothetical protein